LPLAFAALLLVGDAAFALRARGFGRDPAARASDRVAEHLPKALDRLGAVAFAVAEAVAMEDQGAGLGEAGLQLALCPRALGGVERFAAGEVEAENDLGFDLVDILSARAARSGVGEVELAGGNRDSIVDLDGFHAGTGASQTCHCDRAAATADRAIVRPWRHRACAGLEVASLLGSGLLPRLLARPDRRSAIIGLCVLRAAGVLLAATSFGFGRALAGLLTQSLGTGASDPMLSAWTNEHASSEQRATVLSVQTMSFMLGGSVGLLAIGEMASLYGISVAWGLSSAVFVAGAGVAWRSAHGRPAADSRAVAD